MAENTATETTETENTGATITELVAAIKERTGKDVEQQNLRAVLRGLVKKGTLVHEPRTRWAFSDEEVDAVVDHYSKAPEAAEEGEEKPAKKSRSRKAPAKKAEPAAEEPEVEDDDDLELEDI